MLCWSVVLALVILILQFEDDGLPQKLALGIPAGLG